MANAEAISSGTAFPFDAEAVRRGAARGYDRAYHPKGTGRQFAAILAAGDRTAALGQIRVPTLVVHGTEDQVIGVSGGEATAAAIPGARLLRVPGLGHELPPGFWPTLADALVAERRSGRWRPRWLGPCGWCSWPTPSRGPPTT